MSGNLRPKVVPLGPHLAFKHYLQLTSINCAFSQRMLQQLRNNFTYINDEQWDRYVSLFHRIEVPAKTILLKEGDVSNKAFIIEKGCIRIRFNNDGVDVTFQFFFEGQGISSIESFKKNVPSFFTIETIEPSILHWISKKDFNHIISDLEQHKEYNKMMLDFIAGRQFHYMKQLISFIKDKPQDRYLNLLRDHPEIVQRVPQHYIASYLGITPVSLSRIRNKLLKNGK